MVRMFIESGYDGELEYNSTLNRFYPPKYPATLALAMKTEFRIDLGCTGDLRSYPPTRPLPLKRQL